MSGSHGVLVTGGAGYVGSHTAHLLRRAGRQVVILDRRKPHGHIISAGAAFVQGDVADRDLVERLLDDHGVESVIHFAADKNVGESMLHPEKYFANNVAGTLALLTAMASRGVRRFVLSSSCSVYGSPETLPVTEESPLHPESPYAETKVLVERMLTWFDRCHAMRSLSLRYFNAAGADFSGQIGEEWDRSANLIPVVMKAALGVGPPVEIFGTDYPTPDGTAIRDYIHVVDLADAHLKALDYLADGGVTDAVNLGTGQGSSVREVIDMVAEVGDTEVPTVEVGRREGDPMAVYADNRKAQRILGWAPQYHLRDIIETAWNWHARMPQVAPQPEV